MKINLFLRFFKRRVHKVNPDARLSVALGLAISAALILTCVSVAIYSIGGSSRLDLSRPGFERERSEIRSGESAKVYDTTSPVTSQAIDDFLKEYDNRTQELQEFGDFRDQALDDASLQLGL